MKRLKELREAYGLSQQKLASNFHLSQQSIYKYENNLAEPDIDMLKSLAAFFDTSVDYLIEYTDNCSAYVSNTSFHPTSTEHRLLTYYRKLSPRLRRIVFDLIQESAENAEEIQTQEETPASEAANTEKRKEEN